MQRRAFWLHHWLMLSVGFLNNSINPEGCWEVCTIPPTVTVDQAKCCMGTYSKRIQHYNIFKTTQTLERILEKTEVNETTGISVPFLVALLQKPPNVSKSIEIYVNGTQAQTDVDISNRVVRVQLPAELHAGMKNKILFCMIQLANKSSIKELENLSYNRLVGVSVGRNVAGLKERINITMNIESSSNKTLKPQCVFLNTTAEAVSSEGCTEVEYNQTHVTCSCDHLTYFGVLMVSADIPPKDAEILFYITYIGCSISLFALVITVLIFITNRKIRDDDSKKIHISLVVALILLNVHFLPNQAVAEMSSTKLCLYVALLLHYSLLASFTWMALEGFHLYLLLVKVFNIYMRRYLLKLSVVGWGLPAVIVSVVVIRDIDTYGRTYVDSSNGTEVCYIIDDNVKMVATVGVFGLVFLFNLVMFGVMIKWFMGTYSNKEHGQSKRNLAKKKLCTLLVLQVLLGLSWGLIFFSLGYLNMPILYIFCIVNSLQGFFIFIYFLLSLKNTKESIPTDTQSHNSKPSTA